MNHFSILKNYFLYLLKAKTKHGVHSPFVYQFISGILNDRTRHAEFGKINEILRELQRSDQTIQVTDFGAYAGDDGFVTRTGKVREIARNSAISSRMGGLLFRMVRFYKPENILELGTSFGISSLFLGLANPDARLSTIEGCPETAEIARQNFEKLNARNIGIHVGEFSSQLEKVIAKMPRLDFVYVDGNHRKKPTLHYFNTCLKKAHNETIMVFDDIHWSKEMEAAWKQICSHPDVTVSIDIFRIGIVFFRKELSRQQYVIR